MKHLSFLLATFIILSTNSNAQNCCKKPGADFKLLALSDDFKASHLSPEPFTYIPEKGSMIQFNTLDGHPAKAYYIPSDAPTGKVLIIFHEWWGLNDYIKREAEKWQNQLGNIDVYAVDLFDGAVATNPEQASKLAESLDKKRGENIIKGLLSKIGLDKQVATRLVHGRFLGFYRGCISRYPYHRMCNVLWLS